MSEKNLKLIAEARCSDPLNTWPQHIEQHRITIMGNPLFDFECLRCWLERVETERLKKLAAASPQGKGAGS